MSRRSVLVLLSLVGCYTTPEEPTCTSIPLPDPVSLGCDGDLDGDGLLDCDDTDIDGDGLRNEWDCRWGDNTITWPPTEGLCTDGDLAVDRDQSALDASQIPSTLLQGDASAGDTELLVVDARDFVEGDQVLILSQQGEGAGTFEYVMVAAADAGTLTVEPYIVNDYPVGPDEVVLVQRVPQYQEVAINATLGASAWDTDVGGGVVAFRACGAVEIGARGAIDLVGAGFEGGVGVAGNTDFPFQGSSYTGPGAEAEGNGAPDENDYEAGLNNAGGGGAPLAYKDQRSGGGGGSYGGAGTGDDGLGLGDDGKGNDGELLALAGESYGEETLSVWFIGSGGGGGAVDIESDGDDDGNISGTGGAGGGLIAIYALESVLVDGAIIADGGQGEDAVSVEGEVGGGGGGSGGQVMLVSAALSGSGTVTALGGDGGKGAQNGETEGSDRLNGKGGWGGEGRIREDAADDPNVSTSPDPYKGDFSQWCWSVDDPPPSACVTDSDGDGVVAWECGGADCNDGDNTIFPDADDLTADGIDQNCDGLDACDDAAWLQGGLKTTSCATGGDALSGLVGLSGALAALLLRRRP